MHSTAVQQYAMPPLCCLPTARLPSPPLPLPAADAGPTFDPTEAFRAYRAL